MEKIKIHDTEYEIISIMPVSYTHLPVNRRKPDSPLME